jgi:NTP-dependent ternary system trypsin peptidase co-occuring protein
MTYVMEVPVDSGGRLLVQVTEDDLPDGLVPAARVRPGQVVAYAKESVEAAIDQIRPAIDAVTSRLDAMAADEVTVEFGLMLGLEGGAVVAKGKAEVHFTVSLLWKHQKSAETSPQRSSEPGATPGSN